MGSPCPKPLKGMTVTDFLPFISKVKFTVLIHCLIILKNFSQKPNALGSQDESSLHFFMSFDKIQFNSEMTLFLLGFFLKKNVYQLLGNNHIFGYPTVRHKGQSQ